MKKSTALICLLGPNVILWVGILFILLTQSACTNGIINYEEGCFADPLPNANCFKEATVISNTCATGLWGDKWLQLEDGTILQPFSTVDGFSVPQSLQEGAKVKIGYVDTFRDGRYDKQVTCLAIPPYEADAVIKINCFEMVTK
ncbi:MAG: hypothetical protein EAZ57_03885 [Cytophagales bacterium]|nr:MAG: hypothetical protein EAZ67_04900 [Cytophagales bacterium]TAF61351.1 MAG: hypothetical protein EAZ57_03885 [Cytophagales bacterium]